MFEHTEYHIYTTTERLEKRHIHLTEDELSEATELHESACDLDEWKTIHRLKLADGIWLTVGDGIHRAPSLESCGYEGWAGVVDGKFEEPVHFDSMIFHKCIGTHGREPEWSFADVKEWVNYEHRSQFEQEFDDYIAGLRNPDDVTVDW